MIAPRDDGDEGAAWEAELSNRGARDRVAVRDVELDEVERARIVHVERLRNHRRRGLLEPECRGHALSAVPWTSADTSTTKKTALKIVSPCATPAESTNVPRTMGLPRAAPPNPGTSFAAVKLLNAVDAQTATGRTTNNEEQGEDESGDHHGREVAREDEQAEHDEHRHLGQEGKALVEAHELTAVPRGRAADGEADEIDREEAAAAASSCTSMRTSPSSPR